MKDQNRISTNSTPYSITPRSRLSRTTRRIAALLCVSALHHFGATHSAFGDAEYSDVVGFQRMSYPTNLDIKANPFKGRVMREVVGNDGVNGTSSLTADNVDLYNPESQSFTTYYLRYHSSLGYPEWRAGTQWATNVYIDPGVGFWYRNRSEQARTNTMVGNVVLELAVTNLIHPGLQMLSCPFGERILLSDLNLKNGAHGASPEVADNIMLYVPETQTFITYYLDIDPSIGSPEWRDTQWATNVYIEPGQGFWFRSRQTNVYEWVETNRYSLPPPAADFPAEPALTEDGQQFSIRFASNTSMYYQVWASETLYDEWTMVRGMALGEGGQQSWTDEAGVNEYTRLYYRLRRLPLSNPDDYDGDGMPDVWELNHGLNPVDPADAAADFDGDRLVNLEECLLDTNPRMADTSGDGLSDGEKVAFGLDPLSSDSFHTLPWSCNFEMAEDYQPGSLHSQQGWIVLLGSSMVQPEIVFNGDYAAQFTSDESGQLARVQNIVLGPSNQVIWTDIRIQMIPSPLPAEAPDTAHVTALIRIDSDLVPVGFDGISRTWVSASGSKPADLLSWLHLTVKRDYASKTWTLYRDGIPILKDLGFADPAVERPALVRVDGGGSYGTYCDALSVSAETPTHIDDDNDGIANAVEPSCGTDPYNPDTDGDGMDDGRELDWDFDQLLTNDFERLPWTADFETSEGYQTGLLNGQKGWFADASVSVQSAVAVQGNQAVKLQSIEEQGAAMTRYFGAHDEQIVWFETYARMQPGALPDPADFPNTHAALFAVNEHGRACAYDSKLSQWRISTPDHRVFSDDWTRIVMGLDYRLKEWSLYINNVRVFDKVPFLHPAIRSLSRAQVSIPTASPFSPAVYVDAMSVQTAEPELLDNDGDGMPNAWEIMYGLNPENPSDKWGDRDGDGLSNYDECLHGTDPTNCDTDGDGISDCEEVCLALTDPLTADFEGSPIVLMTLPGSQTTARLGEWYSEGGLISGIEPNGYVEYLLTLPSAGIYVLELDVRQGNPLTTERRFDVFPSVSGYDMARMPVSAQYGSTTTARLFLPFLGEGDHVARIQWQTRGVRSIFQIVSVRLLLYPGPDENQTGMPDWMDNHVANSFAWYSPGSTFVSPICLEGLSIYPDMVRMKASYVPEGMETQAVSVRRAIANGWFADVSMSPTSDTEIAVLNPNGSTWFTNSVNWTPLDLLQPPTNRFRIRAGDSLLLSAGVINTSGVTSVQISGITNYAMNAGECIQHTFPEPGSFFMDCSFSNGVVTNVQIEVEVVQASFAGDPICMIARQRTWDCPLLPLETRIEYDSRLAVSREVRPEGGTRFKLGSGSIDRQGFIARLEEGGAILDSVEVKTLYFDSTAARVVSRIIAFPDGSDMIEVALRFNAVPPDFEIHLVIFVGGVTFEDGTIERIVTAADLNEIGEYRYRIIRSPNQQTSICHTMEFFQDEAFILNAAQ